MQDDQLIARFDKFWRSLDPEHQRKTNLYVARQAFIAGSKAARPVAKPAAKPANKLNVYRFQSGRWRVTVKAKSITEAKAEARKTLDQRAQKLGGTPPAGGWQLTQVRYEV